MIQDCRNLDELWYYVDKIHKKYFLADNLMPILGNGDINKPKIMFVFINPTSRNISSDKNWEGLRFPFIGTKQVWRIFHKAGLFDNELMDRIDNSIYWSIELTNHVLSFLQKKGFYFTNIVKCTGRDATLSNSKKIKLFLPILKREIEIVKPKYIVSFGLIPLRYLIKEKIKLSDYYSKVIENKKLIFYDLSINSFKSKVIPCYFPVGRGNPKKSVEILKLLHSILQ